MSLLSLSGELKYVGRGLQIQLVAKFLVSVWSFIMANEYLMHYVMRFNWKLLYYVNTITAELSRIQVCSINIYLSIKKGLKAA